MVAHVCRALLRRSRFSGLPAGRVGGAVRVGARKKPLTLAGLEPGLRLVNDVHLALAAHQFVIAMTRAQRFQ